MSGPPDSGQDGELRRLNRTLERRASEARLLADLVTALRDADDVTQTLQTIAEKLAAGLEVDRCHLLLREDGRDMFRVVVEARAAHLPSVLGREAPADDPDVAGTMRGVQVAVADNAARPSTHPRPISGEAHNSAFVLTPLRRARETFGILSVAQASGPRAWREDELLLLGTLADHAAVAIERARLREETERRHRRLLELNARLVEADRLRRDLATRVLPELRAPLSTLQMTLDMLELQAGGRGHMAKRMTRAETRRMIQAAQASCERILSFLNGISDESGAESHSIDIVRRRCSASEIVDAAVAAAAGPARGKAVTVRSLVEPEVPTLSMDVEHLAQALAIYLRNAVSVTPQGGRVAVEARLAYGGGGERVVVFSVMDEGPGFPPETVPYAFDAIFSTLWASETDPGAPTDLPVVRRIAAAHGGTVGVKSCLGAGSVFSLVLPIE